MASITDITVKRFDPKRCRHIWRVDPILKPEMPRCKTSGVRQYPRWSPESKPKGVSGRLLVVDAAHCEAGFYDS